MAGSLVLALGALTTLPAPAAQWRITPGVSLGETYSDNITLAPPGLERGDFVTEANASLGVHGKSRRITLDLDYNLQALGYARGTGDPTLNNQLQVIANAELIPHQVFVDLHGTVHQENVSSVGRLADSNISVTGNRTNVMTYSISPYFRHHFGNYADSELRYAFETVDNSSSGTTSVGTASTGSHTNRMLLTLSSGSYFQRLPWKLKVSNEVQNDISGTSSKFRQIELEGRYRITRTFAAILGGGYESNDYAASTGTSTRGADWKTGLSWTPTSRTSVDVGLNGRAVGTSFFLDAHHRSRRTALSFKYSEDTTTSSQIELQRQLIPLVDVFGQPILNPNTGQALVLSVNQPAIVNEVLLRKRFEGGLTFKGRRTDATVNLYHERRIYQLSGNEEKVLGGTVTASRKLSRRTTASAQADWQRSDLAGGFGRETRLDLGLSLTHQLSRSLSATVNVKRVRQTSSLPSDAFDENRYSVQMKMKL